MRASEDRAKELRGSTAEEMGTEVLVADRRRPVQDGWGDRSGRFIEAWEATMALARVVTFEGVTNETIEAVRAQVDGDPPEGLPAKEIIVLHDPDAAKSLVVVFFDNEDDYGVGDATLNAMSRADTPGNRTSVTKYEVPLRRAI